LVNVTDSKKNRAERSLQRLKNDARVPMRPLQNDAHVYNFAQLKSFMNASTQRVVHDKMRYLETGADTAFEILKEKFQYIFDRLEPENKQHYVVKGQFVSYTCKSTLLLASTRLVTIFHW